MIGIVIVNWRGYEVTINLISQILGSSYQDFKLIVVNNSPEEKNRFEQTQMIHDPRIVMLHPNTNIGYSGGLNTGLNVLMTHTDVDKFLLLNNDIEIDKEFIGYMLREGKENNKIYAPLIMDQNTDLVQNSGGNILIWMGGSINLNKNVPLAKVHKKQPDFLSGCILFMHRNVIEKVGLFDETYGSYYEDVDYCYRSKKLGIQLEILWDISVRHFHSYSTIGNSNYKIYLLNRNQIIFAKKNLPPLKREFFIIAAVARGWIQCFYQGKFKAYFRGIGEGLLL